jgi:hypothetical protein
MTTQPIRRHQAADVLKRVVERTDQGEADAPGWPRERLVGVKSRVVV